MNRATWRFTAPGEAVESAFPTTRMSKTGFERLSGTSMASALAAGVAAMVLAFARQPPLSYAFMIVKCLEIRYGREKVKPFYDKLIVEAE
jgi:hypothetical protein